MEEKKILTDEELDNVVGGQKQSLMSQFNVIGITFENSFGKMETVGEAAQKFDKMEIVKGAAQKLL